MSNYGYQTIGGEDPAGAPSVPVVPIVPREGYGDHDERVFLVDSQEYFTSDTFCRGTISCSTNMINVCYRASHRVGMLVAGALLLIILPIWGFIVGMMETTAIILIRPAARILGKIYSEILGTNYSSRYFKYRDYKDYRASFFDSGLLSV